MISLNARTNIWDSVAGSIFAELKNRDYDLHERLRKKFVFSDLDGTRERLVQFITNELQQK